MAAPSKLDPVMKMPLRRAVRVAERSRHDASGPARQRGGWRPGRTRDCVQHLAAKQVPAPGRATPSAHHAAPRMERPTVKPTPNAAQT